MTFLKSLFVTKTVERIQHDARANGMKRSLTALDLTMIGVGDIIGAGVFVITGTAAANYAGPAVILSFLFSGIACAFAGLSYAELASLLPISGSAYTYAYACLGQLPAFIIGFDLMLEYLVGSALVAQGWTAYLIKMCKVFGLTLSPKWTSTPWEWTEKDGFVAGAGYINLPALLIVAVITAILCLGAKQSANFTSFFVVIKLVVILLFLFATVGYVNPANWSPFIVTPTADDLAKGLTFGWGGIFKASFNVFFSYIGFDAVSTTAGEAKNPARDLPIGILGSLTICTLLYMAVAFVLTGIANFRTLAGGAPLASAVAGLGMNWLVIAISVGALAGLTSVIAVALNSQPRVFFSMAQDGLLPPIFAKLHPKYKTPIFPLVLNGVVVGLASAFLPIDVLSAGTSSGTLLCFTFVCASVMMLRFTRPDVERPFRVPGGPILVPGLGMATCLFLLVSGGKDSLIRLFGWMAIGIVIYFGYSRRHAKLDLAGEANRVPDAGDDFKAVGPNRA
ncbi:hypothetical protein H9P43_002616 [Blastocladiella emersonii ATCC 22665]|nr:hypothetical protein H9P43_002616 [Blastocladiella emersonii ATCC 22665]